MICAANVINLKNLNIRISSLGIGSLGLIRLPNNVDSVKAVTIVALTVLGHPTEIESHNFCIIVQCDKERKLRIWLLGRRKYSAPVFLSQE